MVPCGIGGAWEPSAGNERRGPDRERKHAVVGGCGADELGEKSERWIDGFDERDDLGGWPGTGVVHGIWTGGNVKLRADGVGV